MNKTKNILIIILILVFLIGAVIFFIQEDKEEGPIIEDNGTEPEEVEEEEETEKETPTFTKAGNIIVNNPGLKEDTFYLSYEKPGAPALSKELSFNKNSICIKGEEVKCEEIIPEDKEEWSGKRVKVEGAEENNKIIVQRMEFPEEVQPSSKEDRIQIAKDWIINNSPTYKYDGKELIFVEERGLDLVECEDCYELEFEFTSTHGGYGDRADEPVIQVITPHTIVVLIDGNEVKKVTTDNKFNEMTGEMIQ